MRPLLTFALVLTLIATASGPAAAGELAGVTLPDTAQVGGEQLRLNGMGLREKFFIDVYVAGLYLPSGQTSGEAILSADTPRRTVMHFVYDVDRGKICDAWNESLEANVPDASAGLKKDFETLCSWMADLADGETMTYTYVPGEGTTVEVQGETKGTIEGKAFADALWASWIGEHPATGKLKKGLLGG
ncbi:MAG: chalcone isomerase family protein [Acidobacteriota bacterium]